MSKDKFSFRWGIKELDDTGGLYLYGFMLKNYAAVGITRDEFLCVIHLAAYHYELKSGESRPALATIAAEMGYSHPNSVRNLIKSLQAKNLIEVEPVAGKPNIYNAHNFARAMLDRTPTPEYIPTPTLECSPPLQPNVAEEEEEKKKPKNKNISAVKPRPSKKSEDETCPKEWMDRLHKLTGVSIASATGFSRTKIKECGLALIHSGHTLEQVDLFEKNWYANEWHKKNHILPKPHEIQDQFDVIIQNGTGKQTSSDESIKGRKVYQ